MKRRISAYVTVVLALAATLTAVLWPQAAGSDPSRPGNKVIAQQLAVELGQAPANPKQAKLSSGIMYGALAATGELDRRANAVNFSPTPRPPSPGDETLGCPNVFAAGDVLNIRVNQDCSFRRQAEEVVVMNPGDSSNLIAGQNDSRIGFNHCGYDWSFDEGNNWGDQIPPFYQFTGGDGHTFDACSDPTIAFDSAGNAYIAGVLFDVAADASALIVMKSNNDIGGSYFHTPDSTLTFQEYRDTPVGVVASDNDPNIAHDKEFIAAKKNKIVVTWTRFDFDTGAGVGGHSPIYYSQSMDGGRTWSPGVEISGANPALCTDFSGEANPNACDQDQGSHPVVNFDGKTVYVAFGNGNTPDLGINQHLIVKCSATCQNAASWSMPKKISDDIGVQPVGPDSATGCPAGRQCLPPNGYRMDDFVEGSLSQDTSGKLYFVWADGRNIKSNCNPNGPANTATPPCNNDVFYAYSTDGGNTWSAAKNVTPDHPFGKSAQWQPWSQVTRDGKHLWIAYYDRHYGSCETDGCNDITLTDVTNAATGSPSFSHKRITTDSMPDLNPANNPLEAGFIGDYMWVSVDNVGKPLVVWADTRGQFLGSDPEEDVYFYKPNPN